MEKHIPEAKLLLIEDNPIVLMAEKLVLSHVGFQVDCAKSAQEALTLLGNHPYKLILIDIGLPDMDGILLTKRISKLDNKARLVGLTAHYAKDIHAKCKEAGMSAILTKPLTMITCQQLFQQYIEIP